MRVTWIFLLLLAINVEARDLASSSFEKKSWLVEVWTAGGKGLMGTTKDTGLWITGGRFGKFLTRKIEYDIEVVPVFMVFQHTTVYGLNVTPLLLKWNMRTSGRFIPYIEGGGGLLFTSSEVPDGTSRFNFTPQVGVGLQLFSREKRALRTGIRYMHISNGGLESPNPGINTLQFLIGYEWFK